MRRLDRAGMKVSPKWQESARKAFPDYASFEAKATAFEALAIDDPVRRAGFKKYAAEVLPKKGKKGACEFKAIWGRLKRALAAMSYQKCAYCETPINAERSAAVEHFKPKSLFPTLVYDHGNYFLGCGGCNGSKADRWPAGGLEYVRPDEGDPHTGFTFRESGRMEAVLPGGPAEETIQDFDLNRDWLCELRKRAIEGTLRDLEALSTLGDLLARKGMAGEQVREVQREMANETFRRLDDAALAYSVALKQCFERAWGEKFPGEAL